MIPSLPTISLVTPSFNQGRFLRATIESVLSQEYPGLDYFVQDGGSSDESLAILEEFAPWVRSVSGKDGGQADAINRAFSRPEAVGEVLGYLNSDDLLCPGTLRRVGEAFAADPELLLVYGRAFFIDEQGKRIGTCLTHAWEPRLLPDSCFVTQPAAFWSRKVMDEIGPFDTTLHHTMDYDYWLRFAARFPARHVRYLDHELAAARLHPDAKTVAGWDRALEEILSLVERRTGRVSLWWLVAKWDNRLDGRSQATAPHLVPWRAYPPAVWEFVRRNRFPVWLRGLFGGGPGLLKRIRQSIG